MSDKTNRKKLYTGRGDTGNSRLYNGEERSKADPIFKVLGEVDKLNVYMGRARFIVRECLCIEINGKISIIQDWLYNLASSIATPRKGSPTKKLNKTQFPTDATKQLEQWIDDMWGTLPKIDHFIKSYGTPGAFTFDMARIVCRELELSLVALKENGEVLEDTILPFVNRLSSYLYVCSTFMAFRETEGQVEFFVSQKKLAAKDHQ